MAEDVKDQTGLVKRGGIYYFRARISKEIRDRFGGKTEVIKSLLTRDKKEALSKAAVLRLDFLQRVEHARKLLSPETRQALSGDELSRLAALYHADQLAGDEEIRAKGRLADGMFSLYGASLEKFARDDARRVAQGVGTGAYAPMDVFLLRYGIRLTAGTEEYRTAAYAFAKEDKKVADALRLRQQGEVVDTPSPAPFITRTAALSPEGDTLAALVAYWKTQRAPSGATIREVDRVVKRFVDLNPNLPASRITKAHIVSFKDTRLTQVSPSSAVKDLNLLKAIFSINAENGKIPANPGAGVVIGRKLIEDSEEERRPYTVPELANVFASKVYTEGYRPSAGSGDAAFWLPLLGLFTGARMGEIATLEVADVRDEEGWFLFIEHAPKRGKSTKTRKSRRVPLHAELIRCGFLQYVARQKEAGERELFPLIKSSPGRARTGAWSQWYGRYLREDIGIADPDVVFHSFRHTFKDICREARIQEEEHDAMTGHKNASISRKYGNKLYPLGPLHECIKGFHVKGLTLAHLYPPALPEFRSKGDLLAQEPRQSGRKIGH